MRLRKIGGSLAVIIPKQVVTYVLKWKEGDELDFEIIERKGKKAIVIWKKDD